MKAVLMSIQPYWLFLIIAKIMGWNISQQKTIEVRKTFPRGENWNKVVKMYCSKNKKSFSMIPEEYQPLMKQFLGKVIGEFVCDEKIVAECGSYYVLPESKTLIDALDLLDYADRKKVYGWHISDLVIYDKPKELGEFKSASNYARKLRTEFFGKDPCCVSDYKITRPPQSWCYVERSDNNGE